MLEKVESSRRKPTLSHQHNQRVKKSRSEFNAGSCDDSSRHKVGRLYSPILNHCEMKPQTHRTKKAAGGRNQSQGAG